MKGQLIEMLAETAAPFLFVFLVLFVLWLIGKLV